jgi:macrolide-specific efflux system membrane fusion protein
MRGSFQGGNANGQRGGGTGQRNFGGQRQGGGNFNAMAAGGATGARPAQRRNGIVMVQKADGTLEQRRIVYGVTNRVHGQVLEGLSEGEEVVIGKSQTEAAAAARPTTTNNNNNNNNRGGGNFQGGNFQGGGFQGGGRPF